MYVWVIDLLGRRHDADAEPAAPRAVLEEAGGADQEALAHEEDGRLERRDEEEDRDHVEDALPREGAEEGGPALREAGEEQLLFCGAFLKFCATFSGSSIFHLK